jgi:endonuclease G
MQRVSARAAHAAIMAAAGDPTDGPLHTYARTYSVLEERATGRPRPVAVFTDTLEVVRRPRSRFPDDTGYDRDFLPGFRLKLPEPSVALRAELAPRLDKPEEYLLPFHHFTTAMHARRRLPVFAALNIEGSQRPEGGMGNRPGWSYDPRIDEAHQPDDSIFSRMVQRGHLAARDYVVWGADEDEQRKADVHSFTLTNACPQISTFNSGRGEWFKIERQIATGARTEGLRVTEFLGPIFRADDPDYDSLRGPGSDAEFETHIRIPLRFWKIVAWVEDGALKHRAFILDQREEVEAAGPLELDIEVPEGVTETTVEEIASLTDLEFSGF